MRDIDYVWLGRLMFLLGGQDHPADASLVGSTAKATLALYGDAEACQEAGGTGVPIRAEARPTRRPCPSRSPAGPKQNGEYNVKLAEALYGYGMYPEAEALAPGRQDQGRRHGSHRSPTWCWPGLAAQGKYDDAAADLRQVNGANPATPRMVRLWSYYVKSEGRRPATAAPAAAASKSCNHRAGARHSGAPRPFHVPA